MAVQNVGEYRIYHNRLLGHGTFGAVFKGWNTPKKPVAAKRIENKENTARSEVEAFYRLNESKRHDNIIRMYGVENTEGFVWIVSRIRLPFRKHTLLNISTLLFRMRALSQDIVSTVNGCTFLGPQLCVW